MDEYVEVSLKEFRENPAKWVRKAKDKKVQIVGEDGSKKWVISASRVDALQVSGLVLYDLAEQLQHVAGDLSSNGNDREVRHDVVEVIERVAKNLEYPEVYLQA